MLRPCPWATLHDELGPPSSFKASELGLCGTDAWISQPHKAAPHTWRPGEALWSLLSLSSQRGHFSAQSAVIFSFFKSERCVCFTASVSSVLPPLTQALRSPCSKMGWVQSSKIPPPVSYLLSPRQSLFIPHFLAHKVCPLYGYFLHGLCHTHRSNLLIGAIKR